MLLFKHWPIMFEPIAISLLSSLCPIMSAEDQVVAPSVSENPEVLADQPTSMVTEEDPTTNGAPVRKGRYKLELKCEVGGELERTTLALTEASTESVSGKFGALFYTNVPVLYI